MTKRLDVPDHLVANAYPKRTINGSVGSAQNTTNMLIEITIPMEIELPVYHIKCARKRKTGQWAFNVPPGKYRCQGCGRVLTVKPEHNEV